MFRTLLALSMTLTGSFTSALGLVECWEESCHTKGWTHRSVEKSQYTDYQCRNDNCASSGWIAGGNEGIQIYTQCLPKGCFKEGWYEIDRWTQELLMTVECRKGGCLTAGWDGYGPKGQSFAECDKNDCGTHGWSLTLPNRSHVFAQCQGKGCFITGWVESAY